MRGSGFAFLTIAAAIAAVGCEGENNAQAPIPEASELYLEAMNAVAAGDNDKALDALDRSIDANPTIWSHRERARLHEKMGDDKAAASDVEAALKLAPDDAQTLWLKGELAKPKAQRFQGKFATPPEPNR